MTDPANPLESELANLRPRDLSPRMVRGFETWLSAANRTTWSDRLLLLSMSCGALAACVIAAILVADSRSVPQPRGPSVIAPSPPAGGELRVLARADDRPGDIWK